MSSVLFVGFCYVFGHNALHLPDTVLLCVWMYVLAGQINNGINKVCTNNTLKKLACVTYCIRVDAKLILP